MSRFAAVKNWTVAAALIGAAWAVTTTLPDDIHELDPFVTTVAVGEQVTLGDNSFTITEVALGASIKREASDTSLPGTWLVFSAEAETKLSQLNAQIQWATLEVGDRTFVPSDQWASQLTGQSLLIDIPQSIPLVFEIPPELAEESAVLRIGNDDRSQHLGDVIEIPIDLATLPVEDVISIPDPKMVGL